MTFHSDAEDPDDIGAPGDQAEIERQVEALRKRGADELAGRMVTVMAGKGGVGKTTIARELAWLLDAVLIDWDWDAGGASRAMGYLHEQFQRAPLLDALESGKPPKPRKTGPSRPELVPSHPDLAASRFEAEEVEEAARHWVRAWNRPVVSDTHPGGGDVTLGVSAAADLVVLPVVLGTWELSALEQTAAELRQRQGIRLLVVPTKVSPQASLDYERKRLRGIAEKHRLSVAPPVMSYTWLATRRRRTVVTAQSRLGQRAIPFAEDMLAVADAVVHHATP